MSSTLSGKNIFVQFFGLINVADVNFTHQAELKHPNGEVINLGENKKQD